MKKFRRRSARMNLMHFHVLVCRYFRQIFRKHTGLTPAAWKRRYSKEHINS